MILNTWKVRGTKLLETTASGMRIFGVVKLLSVQHSNYHVISVSKGVEK